ncbi:MAG TPA: ribosomal-protein-alanine N-acetyltransferase [Candidatus Desulfofervidus auxilii]|uniref:Ribosomal-protein-alanine N-acetyltransferase n=1 Tax=Desulfofervidus auxilii TaxID=1621989 RepID=A0A7C0U2U5_DESA2|nr:ribosomal protein S18-alanine N-acetyltransferase [Candidatus Desulfofervidus auxilii]HDD44323.1 ribosomal-protein-alanine N-acetyltransferase [Candidatus Desulfofervidus auxilii]
MWDVVSATKEDIDTIYEIEKACFFTPWSKEAFYEELKHDYSYLWIAKNTNTQEIGGFICFWIIWGEMHILNLAVKPELQGKGIGSLLLKRTLEFAEKNEVEWIRLEVRSSNLKAISFYKKFGFKKIGKRKHYYFDTGEDAIIMALSFKNLKGGVLCLK